MVKRYFSGELRYGTSNVSESMTGSALAIQLYWQKFFDWQLRSPLSYLLFASWSI